jgi:hypothetical protein
MSWSSAGFALAVLVLVVAPQDPPPDAATLLRAEQLAQPGERHLLLQRLVGEWDVVTKTPAADGERVERGSMKAAAILGGRYVQLEFALTAGGRKLDAVQTIGFDRLREQFVASWRDSASTWSTECAGAPRTDRPELVAMAGMLADAKDPAGTPFRLEIDLAYDQRVAVRIVKTAGGGESVLQTQTWARR